VRDFVHALLRAYFAEGRNIGEAPVVAQVADEVGLDAAEMAVAVQDPAIKEQLKRHVDEAIARGVFGAPFFFVDGEPFWGNDRLPQIERWLAHGPF
jgi:2-hydroxychromene-2-carboxylate isomerase